jgi:hypothetical protein
VSANNYAVCPRCTIRAAKKAAELMEEAEAAYGSVPAQEYAAMITEASAAAVLPGNVYTFREDWEIYGAANGAVVVDYGGSCETCGLSLRFKDEHPIPGATDGR